MIFLDAHNTNQVDGARVIEADLGIENRKVMIFSGIAMPAFIVNDDEHIYRETAVINLRRTVLAVEQYTVSVGLASIGNDETLFLIAADSASVDIDPTSQEVLLKVEMALEGESTSIGRFGYQLVMVVTTQTTGIAGTIRWNKSIFNGETLVPGILAQTFKISANTKQRITPPGGGFVYDKLTPVAYGFTKGLSQDMHDFIVPYEIPSAPYNQPLTVVVEIGAFFTASSVVIGQVAGPDPVVLAVSIPGVTGVDFRIAQQFIH